MALEGSLGPQTTSVNIQALQYLWGCTTGVRELPLKGFGRYRTMQGLKNIEIPCLGLRPCANDSRPYKKNLYKSSRKQDGLFDLVTPS